MFTSCPNTEHDFQVQLHKQGSSKDAGDFKHHVDYFFVRALLDTDGPLGPWSRTEQPEEAELFVVPGLCSQARASSASFGGAVGAGRGHWQRIAARDREG